MKRILCAICLALFVSSANAAYRFGFSVVLNGTEAEVTVIGDSGPDTVWAAAAIVEFDAAAFTVTTPPSKPPASPFVLSPAASVTPGRIEMHFIKPDFDPVHFNGALATFSLTAQNQTSLAMHFIQDSTRFSPAAPTDGVVIWDDYPPTTPTSSPTQSPTPSMTSSPTHSPTASATASVTPSPTPSVTSGATATPSPTPSNTQTPMPSASHTASPTASATPSATSSPTSSPTTSPTPSRTPSPTASASPAETSSPSPSPTATPSPTSSPQASPTATASATASPPPTNTPADTPTPLGNNTVSGLVFNDLNRNGISDFEPGISNAQVSLIPLQLNDGVTMNNQITFTDHNGIYAFIDLPSGTYKIQFGPPPGYIITFANVTGASDDIDSDADPTSGFTHPFRLENGIPLYDVWAGMFDESLLTPTPIDTPTATPVPTDEVNVAIIEQPHDIIGYIGQNLKLFVRDWPDNNHHEWSFTNLEPTRWVGTDSEILSLPSVTHSNEGAYQVDVSRMAGDVRLHQQSRIAQVTVLERGLYNPANSATYLSDSIPANMLVNQQLQIKVVMANTSPVSWSNSQGYALQVLGDSCDMFGPVNYIPVPEGIVIQPGESWEFTAFITAPAFETICHLELQMVELGQELFGDIVSTDIYIGSVQVLEGDDFSSGWYYGRMSGEGSGVLTPQGMSMTTPPNGENLAGWVGPLGLIPLKDTTAYEVRVEMRTNQTVPDNLPALSLTFDNFPANTIGGDYTFVTNTGWNGIREGLNGPDDIVNQNGLDEHVLWFTPNTAILPQWRGGYLDGFGNWIPVDPENSAFATRADSTNDLRMVIRYLDLDSAHIKAEFDSGTVVIHKITITSRNLLDELPLNILAGAGVTADLGDLIYHRPITESLMELGSYEQIDPLLGGGPALYSAINDSAQNAVVALAESGPGARRTLFNLDNTTPTLEVYPDRLFPPENNWVLHEEDGRVWGIVDIEAAPGSYRYTDGFLHSVDPANPNPPDIIGVLMDVVNIDIVMASTSVAAPNGEPMAYAATPRLRSQLGGRSQYYIGALSLNHAPLSEPAANQRFRLLSDIVNTNKIRPSTTGDDPTQINGHWIVKPRQ